jgi:subtilisin family serine protease
MAAAVKLRIRAAAALAVACTVLAVAAQWRPQEAGKVAGGGELHPQATGSDTGSGAAGVLPYAAWIWLDEAAAASALPPAVSPEVLAVRGELDTDRPVNPELVARVAATGARVRLASRWLRAIAVEADSGMLARLADMPEVIRITAIRSGTAAGQGARTVGALPAAGAVAGWGAGAWQPAAPAPQDSARYGATWAPLLELNIPALHALGIDGRGVRIAIFDTGFLLQHEALAGRQVAAQRDFINNVNSAGPHPADPPNQLRHGTAVWSLLGGYREGQLVGGAPEASYYLAKVKRAGPDRRADEDRWVAAAEWADSLGVHVINSSIGFRNDFIDREPIPYGALDGNTTATTRAADEAARRGILVVVAVGNSGPAGGSLWAPADGDSVISVGSVDRLQEGRVAIPTDVSSRGPTADGRAKPELAARGAALTAASAVNPTFYETGFTGSSFATPFVAASAALFRQAWPGLSAMAIRSALMLAGSEAARPNNVVGHGVPDVAGAVMMPEGIVLGPQSLTTLDLEGSLTTVLPTFRWETPLVFSQMRPILYTVQVARDSAFQNLVYADTVREANVFMARTPLPPTERAWWRVVATSEASGVTRVSAPRPSFRVPPWVRLLTYNSPETVFTDSLRPTFAWAPLSAPAPVGPFTYDVEVLSVATGLVVQVMPGLTTSTVRVTDPLLPNMAYRWRVIVRSRTGHTATVESQAPFVVQSSEAPPATILYRPFPNPFPYFLTGDGTSVWFDLHRRGPVELNVYDLRGRLVKRMIPARPDCGIVWLSAGLYGRGSSQINTPGGVNCAFTRWDGSDENGRRVPAGVYIFRLRANGVTDVHRVLFQPPAF